MEIIQYQYQIENINEKLEIYNTNIKLYNMNGIDRILQCLICHIVVRYTHYQNLTFLIGV